MDGVKLECIHHLSLNSTNESYTSFQNHSMNISLLRELLHNNLLGAPIGNDVIILSAIYVPIFLLGLLGNGVILFIIANHPRLRNITNLFLWNLALTDTAGKTNYMYSKTCVKRPLKNRENKDLDDKW